MGTAAVITEARAFRAVCFVSTFEGKDFLKRSEMRENTYFALTYNPCAAHALLPSYLTAIVPAVPGALAEGFSL